MENSQQVKKNQPVMKEILFFYVPLALSSVIMMASHNVINSALSRTLNPEAAIAAYAIAQSICNMLAVPNFSGMQLFIAKGRDLISFRNCLALMFKVMVVTTVILGALAFTPIGRIVYVDVFGAPAHLYTQIQAVSKLCIILPVIYILGSTSRSIILIKKKTHAVTLSGAIRIVAMVIMATVIPRYSLLEGALVGGFIWVAGMAVEMICTAIFAVPLFKEWPQKPADDSTATTQRDAFSFIWPLIATVLLWGLGRPALNAGLARTSNPELTLATYQVASNFAWLFIVLIEDNIKQVAVIFGDSLDKLKSIRRFTIITSLIVFALIVLVAVTPINKFILGTVIGVSKEMVASSVGVILLLAVFPLIMAWQEHYAGLLIGRGKTKPVGISRGANLLAMTITIFALSAFMPELGAVAGAIALLVGVIAELLVVRYACKNLMADYNLGRQHESSLSE